VTAHVTQEQLDAAVERYQQARVAAGLPALVSDENTLRMIAAVISSNTRKRAKT
jgi:hypothetical protein